MLKSVLYLPMTNLLLSAAKTPYLTLICFSEGSHLSVLNRNTNGSSFKARGFLMLWCFPDFLIN